MLKLKLQYFGHLMGTEDSSEKTLMLGKIQEKKKRVSEDDMAGWHKRCNEHEFGQTLGDGKGQGGRTCCSPWGRKELDMIERLNKTEARASQVAKW